METKSPMTRPLSWDSFVPVQEEKSGKIHHYESLIFYFACISYMSHAQSW